ncbi:NAD(P)-dependent dehydrogenase, short-chain alcohol dehydrogenase family [Streptomyces sp. OV198]|uniref:SDR family NAD(P)-dependent oxidoreductase n=1 Tax=Streptomyces sp. OV198 TaxID=1882787 RepID=UPI000BDB0450|nr:SDR family oxidoreductase [Streptomyces sp. OV198]SOE79801.1 NAD(P)-dependent dehydrogenase, short-chain alcohol dehydrogenase family [Streptomyces sp. OV198]
MNIDLSGRITMVTGSTAGIGEATAAALTASGAEVVVNGRNPESVAATAERLGGRGVTADVSTPEGADAVIEQVPDVDILVNNTGVFATQPVFEIPDEEWLRFFHVNVLSGIRLARHYTPRMVQRGWGRVVFVSSEAGIQTPTNMVHYGMTKTAQLAVSRGMAQEVAGSGVTVNCVLPGPTLSAGVLEMWADLYPGLDVAEQERRFVADGRAANSLLGRLIRPEEVAGLITYLASDQAAATTGAALSVDGGLVPTVFP